MTPLKSEAPSSGAAGNHTAYDPTKHGGHQPTHAYVRKRTGGDKADLDTLRRLKRYIAREVYDLLHDAISDQPDAVPIAA